MAIFLTEITVSGYQDFNLIKLFCKDMNMYRWPKFNYQITTIEFGYL